MQKYLKQFFYLLRYKQCFDEVVKGFEDSAFRERGTNREDRVHGSLLVLNELFRVAHATWERKYVGLMERLQSQPETKTDVRILKFQKFYIFKKAI